jgi:hypothetical protein
MVEKRKRAWDQDGSSDALRGPRDNQDCCCVVGASAHASDAAVKIAKPTIKILFAPTRLPNAPVVRMKAANAVVWELTIHCSSDT